MTCRYLNRQELAQGLGMFGAKFGQLLTVTEQVMP